MASSVRLFCLAFILGLLVACGPFPTTNTPTSSSSAEVATPGTPEPVFTPLPTIQVQLESLDGLKIQVWHPLNGPAADMFTSQLSTFNAENEWGILVYQMAYAGYDELFEAAQASLAGGEPPELVILLPEQTLGLERVVDLTPYVHDQQWGLTESDLADIPSVFWMQDEANGVRLGVPALRTARLMVYNRTWASELGFDSLPLTGDEFRRQACAANNSKRLDADTTNDGYGGWVIDTDSYTLFSWFSAFGGQVMTGETYRFSGDENLAALTFLKELYDSNCAYLSTEPNPYLPFANRSSLFVTISLGELSALSNILSLAGNKDDWTVLPFPGEDPVITAFGSSYSLLESSEEGQLAAWLFVRWLLSTENQADWARTTGLFPLRISSLDLLADYRLTHPQWGAAVDLIPLAQGIPQRASWSQVRYLLGDGMSYLFRMNTQQENLPVVLAEMDLLAEEIEGK